MLGPIPYLFEGSGGWAEKSSFLIGSVPRVPSIRVQAQRGNNRTRGRPRAGSPRRTEKWFLVLPQTAAIIFLPNYLSAQRSPPSPCADKPSSFLRGACRTEWQLSTATYEKTCKELRREPHIDMFAFAASTKCRYFKSMYPEKGSSGDAFGAPWPAVEVYAFPPYSQVGRTILAWKRGLGNRAGKALLLIAPREHPEVSIAREEGLVIRCKNLLNERLIDHVGKVAPHASPRPLAAFLFGRRL